MAEATALLLEQGGTVSHLREHSEQARGKKGEGRKKTQRNKEEREEEGKQYEEEERRGEVAGGELCELIVRMRRQVRDVHVRCAICLHVRVPRQRTETRTHASHRQVLPCSHARYQIDPIFVGCYFFLFLLLARYGRDEPTIPPFLLLPGMHLGYGGNPYGPAGTGKTESVKALGNAFGRQVSLLVLHCCILSLCFCVPGHKCEAVNLICVARRLVTGSCL